MRYVKSLDGIRGFAVAIVMLFHYGLFAAGWVGVQIFFTLSGYLITSLLLNDKQALPFGPYIRRFYWRRSLRILPLYFVYLLAMSAAYVLWGVPESFRSDWPYLLTYSANFARIRAVEDLGPYSVHIWSLAVEEQFYLIWPFLVYLLSERDFKKIVGAVLVLSPLARLLLFIGLTHAGHDPQYAGRLTYVLPFTQFDAFAAGAAIPLWRLDAMRRAVPRFALVLGVTGAVGCLNLLAAHVWRGGASVSNLGYPMFMTSAYQYVWGYSLLNVLSCLGIVCALQGVRISKLFDNPLLVRVGKVSYGVYVYHLPMLQALLALGAWLGFEGNGLTHLLLFVPYVAAVMIVSEVSFRWLEAPFLRLKDLWSRRDRAVVAGTTLPPA